jgi:hypothetical protein
VRGPRCIGDGERFGELPFEHPARCGVNLVVLKLFTTLRDALPLSSVRADSEAVRPLRSRAFRQAARVSLWAGLLLALATALSAGEKFQITDSTNRVDLPKEPSTDLPGSDLFRSKINTDGGQAPVVPPPNQPSAVRSPILDELIDRKKNWIYGSPNSSLDRDKAIEQIFGVRKYDLDGYSKKPKTAMERQFESNSDQDTKSGARSGRTGKDNPGEERNGRNEYDSSGRSMGSDSLQDRGVIPELNPAYLLNPTSLPDPFAQTGGNFSRSSILPAGLGEQGFGRKTPGQNLPQVEQSQRDDRFGDGRKSPITRFLDPISDPIDGTRSLMNPTAARKPTVPVPVSSQPMVAGSYPSAVSTRPDFFSPVRDRVPGMPNYTPPIVTPSSTPIFQPKPAVLEIPRPRM